MGSEMRLWPVHQALWTKLRNLEFVPRVGRSYWEPVSESVTEIRCAVGKNLWKTPCERCRRERKAGLGGDLDKAGGGQAGMTPGHLTRETVLVEVPCTKEEERIITASNRAHLYAKHCSHLIFIPAVLCRFCYRAFTQKTKLRYRNVVRDHTAS